MLKEVKEGDKLLNTVREVKQREEKRVMFAELELNGPIG